MCLGRAGACAECGETGQRHESPPARLSFSFFVLLSLHARTARAHPLGMSSFKALRELAQQKTAAQNQQVQAKLEERKRKEEADKKAQEERDRRERELEARMRAKKLEDERRAEELARKLAQNAARRAEREEQLQLQRETKLLQRVSRARSPTEPGAVGSRSRKRSRSGSPDGGGTSTLTREEKRARKAQNELRKAEQEQAARARRHIPNFGSYGGRAGGASGSASSATGKRLAGGALDIIDDGHATPKTPAAVGSTRDRIISAMPMQLTKLNTVKRDTRTIDDVQRERQQRVLEGDDARNFGDWFGGPSRSQREAERKRKADEDQARRDKAFALKKQQDTQRTGFSGPSGALSIVPPPSAFQPQARQKPAPVASSSRLPPKKQQPPPAKSSSSKTKAAAPSSSNPNAKAPSKYAVSTSKPAAKRRRELDEDNLDDSEDESDYGHRASRRSILPEDLLIALRGGRSRPAYEEVSDEGSDMEAGLDDVFEEEQRSIAIAKREDQLALREQMNHEAEKRRRLGIRS